MNYSGDFHIVLLHEDLVSGIRGSSVLERLAGQLEMESGQLDIEIWKIAVLRDARLRGRVITALAHANMIIVSAAGGAELPDHIKELIETSCARRSDRDAAIVALLDWERATSGQMPRVGRYLRRLAAQTGMAFFCNQGAGQPRLERAGDSAPSGHENHFAASGEFVPRSS